MAKESKLPYLASYGIIPKILPKIQEAKRPERFTQDFLETRLGHSGGAARAVIPLLKRLGFISENGTPTDRYDAFRNEASRGAAMAQGIREAYKELFERNEFAGDLPKDKLQALIVEVTGAEKQSRTVSLTTSTFSSLKRFADFDARDRTHKPAKNDAAEVDEQTYFALAQGARRQLSDENESVAMNFSYTINLNLPETSDPDVFNAIFRALRENLLTR